jgi:ethanolamine utilization protein EutQ (cupin superfamily)
MGSLLSKVKPSKTPTPEKSLTKMSPPAFTHYSDAQASFKPPLIANENAYLGDITTSEPNDPTAPISGGFYRLEKGTPLVYEYTYHEIKIIVDGEFDISDETGQKVHAVKGDVFYCEEKCCLGERLSLTRDSP